MAFILKIYKRPDGTVLLAICDKECLGKVYSNGKARIDLRGGFYQGEEMGEDLILGLIQIATHLNCVGQKSVELAIREGYVNPESVLQVSGIPYAECVIVRPD